MLEGHAAPTKDTSMPQNAPRSASPAVSTSEAAHRDTDVKHVAVVGAGMVGLATAWFLQEHGVEVTVLDRDGVAAGASWGNAGWLTPGIATPLPEPAVLKYGIGAVLSPSSPVYVPPTANHRLLRFMAGFAAHSTMRSWKKAMTSLVPINGRALESFDLLGEGGVRAKTKPAESFIAAYRTEAERATLLQEIQHIKAVGQDISYDVLSGDEHARSSRCCRLISEPRSSCAGNDSSTPVPT